jgi:hypothetical protein
MYRMSVYDSLSSSTSHGDATTTPLCGVQGGVMFEVPIQEYYRTSWSNKIIQSMAGIYTKKSGLNCYLYSDRNSFYNTRSSRHIVYESTNIPSGFIIRIISFVFSIYNISSIVRSGKTRGILY